MYLKHESRVRTITLFFVVVFFGLMIVTPLWAFQDGGRRTLGFFDFWKLPRVWVSVLFSLAGLFLLVKSWLTRHVRFFAICIIFFVFGVLFLLPLGQFARGMSIHPSPMCVIEKPFLFLKAGRAIPIIFISIFTSVAVLTVVGNKLFCGWACPLGAVQEMMHRIPLPDRLKIKIPFRITNALRIALFILFLGFTFLAGISIYKYLNPFEFFHWGFGLIAIVVFCLTLLAALFVFRPFCYIVCPIGLFTWLIEHISFMKVRIDRDKCTDCRLCIKDSPCPTIPSILEGKKSRPDCHPCGRCIEACPENALRFWV